MKALILDGHPSAGEEAYNRYVSDVAAALTEKGHTTKLLVLRDMSIRFCTGCWSCWWGTPGECVFKDDSHTVCREYINADFVLFFSPVVMGFTSALMKKTQDKLIPLIHPYIELVNGECHHRKRYDVYPRLGVLLHKTPGTDDEDIEITLDMFSRFALNLKSECVFSATTTQPVKEVSDAIDRV